MVQVRTLPSGQPQLLFLKVIAGFTLNPLTKFMY